MALGASRLRILRSIVRQGAVLALAGVALGTIAAVWLTRVLAKIVYGVSTLDPATYAVVGALLVIVAIAASFVPALRAVRLNPVAALRE
jgi:ABC-type antimicrobial peptide transport system permease subunit